MCHGYGWRETLQRCRAQIHSPLWIRSAVSFNTNTINTFNSFWLPSIIEIQNRYVGCTMYDILWIDIFGQCRTLCCYWYFIKDDVPRPSMMIILYCKNEILCSFRLIFFLVIDGPAIGWFQFARKSIDRFSYLVSHGKSASIETFAMCNACTMYITTINDFRQYNGRLYLAIAHYSSIYLYIIHLNVKQYILGQRFGA